MLHPFLIYSNFINEKRLFCGAAICVDVCLCICVCMDSFSVFYNLHSAFCILHSGLGHPISASASFLAMVTWVGDQIRLKRIKGVSPHAVVARLAHHEVRASKHTWAEISVGTTEDDRPSPTRNGRGVIVPSYPLVFSASAISVRLSSTQMGHNRWHPYRCRLSYHRGAIAISRLEWGAVRFLVP